MGYETLPLVDKIYGGVEVGFWIKWPGSGRFGNFLNLKSCIGHGDVHAYKGYWDFWRNFLSKIKEGCFGEAVYRVFVFYRKGIKVL